MQVLSVIVIGCCSYIDPVWAEEDPDAWLVRGLVNETLELERTGAEVPWSNANTGNSGLIRVERTYYLPDGTPCRDYVRTTKHRDGDRSTTEGSGCRMANGRWFLDETPSGDPASSPKTPKSIAAKGPGASGAGAARATDTPETEAKTVAVRTADEEPSAKSGEPPEKRTEKWTPPPPPAKPKVPAFTLPSKSEL